MPPVVLPDGSGILVAARPGIGFSDIPGNHGPSHQIAVLPVQNIGRRTGLFWFAGATPASTSPFRALIASTFLGLFAKISFPLPQRVWRQFLSDDAPS